jgi:hypothetical protein
MTEKEYPVNNFEDLCNLVNSENINRLAEDVKIWLHSYLNAINKIRELYPKETKGMKNSEIAKGSFVWIDDGKNELKGYELINKND